MYKKLKLLQVLTLLIGFWLFAYGFQTLSFLSNVELTETFRRSGDISSDMDASSERATSVVYLIFTSQIAYFIGYILAFGISLLSLKRRKAHWINSVLALILFVVMSRLSITGWEYLKWIFLAPGSLFNGVLHYLASGVLMLFLGAILLVGAKSKIEESNIGSSVKPNFS